MQGKELFEYAVVRFVPRVEREEFINIGVVLYCRAQHFLQMRFSLDPHRCAVLQGDIDGEDLLAYLKAFQQICDGSATDSEIAALPLAERFRWLTAKRSAVIQTSAVHPGLCTDASETLERLYTQLVL